MIFDPGTNIALQATLPGLVIPMLLISLLGLPEFYLAFVPVLLWNVDRRLGVRLLLLVSVAAACNLLLKLLFHTPRPYWVSTDVKAFATETTFGMPSAAAQVSLAFLGYVAVKARKTGVQAGCALLILLVGLSRLYLGVHFAIDILSGWAAALVILWVFLRYEEPAAEWLGRQAAHRRILLALCASALFILLSLLILVLLGNWQVPAGWSVHAAGQSGVPIDPLSLRDLVMAAGILFGTGAGAVISVEYIPFSTEGSWSRKVIRYLAGILVLAAFWSALSASTRTPDLAGYAMTYLRAVFAGLWITAGAPFLFRKTGLSGPAGDLAGELSRFH
jgi:membrane-associated phospholipid phosphatase